MKTHTKSVFLIFLLVLVGCGLEIKVWTEKYPDSDQVKEWRAVGGASDRSVLTIRHGCLQTCLDGDGVGKASLS
jgi:hypothetical protein